MGENYILALDAISFLAFVIAFAVSFRIPREKTGRSTRAFLQVALLLYVFVGFSNILEHSGITAVLDPFEDYLEILSPLLFFFFLYSSMLRSEVGLRLISEKQLLQTIGIAEERFRTFNEHTPAIVSIKDMDGHYLFANEKCRELSGIPENGINSPNWPDAVIEKLRGHDRIVLAEGKWDGIEKVPDHEGKIHTLQTSKFRIPEGNGHYLLGGVALDVTKEHEARQHRRQLVSILEQLGEGIVVTDGEGAIQYVNKIYELRTGYSRDELLGQNPRVLQSGEHDEAFYKELWDTIKSGHTWHGHIINKSKDGSTFYEQATIFPVRDEKGIIVQFAALKRDIGRELELEDMLRQSQKLETIGQLVGGIAHDFNNILTAINGYSELAISNLEPGSTVEGYVKRVRDAGERAAVLTKKLLGFGRKQMIQPKVLDISEMVQGFESIAKRVIGEDIELVLKLGKGLPPIFADPAQIDQVLMNLLVNASDAIHEAKHGGQRKIVVETTETYLDEVYVNNHVGASVGPHILLNVTDTGKGIPKEIQLKIFEPFFTTKEFGLGTGLGLATIFGIIKQNNGSIFVYSEEGKGATFKVYWPIYQVDGLVSEIRKDMSLDNHVVKGEGVILVVEDEEDVRNIASAVLEGAGYTILEADSAEAALEMMESYEGQLDLLFTDMVMPGMNGMELAEKLMNMRPGLKTLYASGYSEKVLEQKGLHGVNGFLVLKPYNRGELTRRVHDLLNRENKVK
ncbi:MAG: PAS domain S-box protein [Holophagae bacterium]|nr:PAS domain S-box protein [Holophagae bacterium]